MKIDLVEAWEFCTKHWVKLGAVLGFIGACFVFPFRLQAVERNDAKQDAAIEEQQSMQRSQCRPSSPAHGFSTGG